MPVAPLSEPFAQRKGRTRPGSPLKLLARNGPFNPVEPPDLGNFARPGYGRPCGGANRGAAYLAFLTIISSNCRSQASCRSSALAGSTNFSGR